MPDGAGRILLQNSLECPARDEEPVRMQHCNAAIKLRLHFRIAGGREIHLAKLVVLLGDRAASKRCGGHAGGKQESCQ
jgi:hypothetical protein